MSGLAEEGDVNDFADDVAPAGDIDSGDGVDSAAPDSERLGPPEWLPEKFWKDGAPNVEALAQSYKHLESKLGKHEDAPEDYQVAEDMGVDTENPIYQSFKTAAKELGLSQKQHDAIVSMYLGSEPKAQEAQMQAWQAHLQEQYKMLGPDADKRIQGIEQWAMNNLGKDDAAVVQGMMTSVDEVRVLERLVAASRDKRLPRRVESIAQSVDGERLREMRFAKDDKGRLRMSTDPEYRKQVDAAYAEYYGNEPAEQIVSGIR